MTIDACVFEIFEHFVDKEMTKTKICIFWRTWAASVPDFSYFILRSIAGITYLVWASFYMINAQNQSTCR